MSNPLEHSNDYKTPSDASVYPVTIDHVQNGLTIREKFTYGAMQALIQTFGIKYDATKADKIDIITSVAVQIADAQIKKLNK